MEEATCVLIVMVLKAGDPLILHILASQMLFSRRLDAGLRDFASAHREAGQKPFQILALTCGTPCGIGRGRQLQEFKLMAARPA